jgi:hypothetical protein
MAQVVVLCKHKVLGSNHSSTKKGGVESGVVQVVEHLPSIHRPGFNPQYRWKKKALFIPSSFPMAEMHRCSTT